MSNTLTIRLSKELSAWLEETSARTGLSQGEIVRNQLEKAKTERQGKPFMRWAGAMRGPKDLSQRKGYSTRA